MILRVETSAFALLWCVDEGCRDLRVTVLQVSFAVYDPLITVTSIVEHTISISSLISEQNRRGENMPVLLRHWIMNFPSLGISCDAITILPLMNSRSQ